MRRTTVVVWLSLVVGAGCAQLLGDDFEVRAGAQAGGAGGSTTSNGGDGGLGGGGADVGGAGGTGGAGGEAVGGAPPCIEGFDGTVSQCIESGGQVIYLLAEEPDVANLTIEIYYGFGDPAPPAVGTPFSFDFYGENYAACGVCARMADQCVGADCPRQLLAIAGHLEVTSHGPAGEPFTGTLTDAVFAEVTIDPNTFESTLVPWGATRCVPWFTFDATVVSQ